MPLARCAVSSPSLRLNIHGSSCVLRRASAGEPAVAPCRSTGVRPQQSLTFCCRGSHMFLCTVNLSEFPLLVAFLTLILVFLAACGGGGPAATQVPTSVPATPAPPATAVAGGCHRCSGSDRSTGCHRVPGVRSRYCRVAHGGAHGSAHGGYGRPRPWLPRRFWPRMPSASSSVPARKCSGR